MGTMSVYRRHIDQRCQGENHAYQRRFYRQVFFFFFMPFFSFLLQFSSGWIHQMDKEHEARHSIMIPKVPEAANEFGSDMHKIIVNQNKNRFIFIIKSRDFRNVGVLDQVKKKSLNTTNSSHLVLTDEHNVVFFLLGAYHTCLLVWVYAKLSKRRIGGQRKGREKNTNRKKERKQQRGQRG